MANKRAVVAHLRNVALFASLTTSQLERIAATGDEITMPAGSLIVDQGQVGAEAFLLLRGAVSVRRNRRRVAVLGPGAVLGELSLLGHSPRTATATCDTDCTMLLITQRHFVTVLEADPAIAQKLLCTLAAWVRDVDRTYHG